MSRSTFAHNTRILCGLALLAGFAQSCTKAELIGAKAAQIATAAKLGIPAVTLDSPAAGSYINAASATALTVSGTCQTL